MEDYYNFTEFPETSSTQFDSSPYSVSKFSQYNSVASSVSSIPSSQVPSDDVEFVFNSYPQRAFIASLMIVASTVGIFGNTLVILSVMASRKLRTITNTFVVNLAVADLLVSLFLPWNALALLAIDGWPLPMHLCSASAGVLFVSVGCSVYTLASIAFNRWIVITQPGDLFQKIFHSKLLCIWMAFTWLIPFIATVIPPLLGFGQLGYNIKYGTCSNVSRNPKSDEYDILTAMIYYPLPMVVIIVSYVKILLHVKRHSVTTTVKQKRRYPSQSNSHDSMDYSEESKHKGHTYEMSETIETCTTQSSSSHEKSTESTQTNGNEHHKYSSKLPKKPRPSFRASIRRRLTNSRLNRLTIIPHLNHRELEITKNMFYIVVVFLVCLTPFTFCLFIDSSDPAIPYAAAMVFFNSCLNPIIYATKHPHFKKVFGLLIMCKLRKVPAPSGCLRALLERPCFGADASYV